MSAGDVIPSAPAGTCYDRLFTSLRALDTEYEGAIFKGDGTPGGLFHCPVHDDENASLEVHEGRTGKPLLSCPVCEAAEDHRAFMARLRGVGVRVSGRPTKADETVVWGDVLAPSRSGSGSSTGAGLRDTHHVTKRYEYLHADGSPNFTVKRWEPRPDVEGADARVSALRKVFTAFHVEVGVGRVPNLTGVERTPYHLDLFKQWAGKPVYLVEGEKACDALLERKKRATTFHGGAKREPDEGWVTRYGFDHFSVVRLWPDADEVGVRWMAARAEELEQAGVQVEWWCDEQASAKDDAYDALSAGRRPHKVGEGAEVPEAVERLGALHPASQESSFAVVVKGGPKPIVSATDYTVDVWLHDDRESPDDPDGADDDEGSADFADPYPCTAATEPRTFVREYLRRHYTDSAGCRTLRRTVDDTFWLWTGTHFAPLLPPEMSARLGDDLDGCSEVTPDGEVRPIKLRRSVRAEVLSALGDLTLVSDYGKAGSWRSVAGMVPFRNGLLDVETGELKPLSPAYDVHWNVPGDYDPHAGTPRRWEAFLASLGWGPDTQEYRLLRQWFGYVLSGETSQQKALMMVGPKRAGKGTIQSVLEAMLGDGAVGLDLSAFGSNFGLQPIIGKALATVGDARFEIKTDKATVRRILSLVGEDSITIDRKHKDPVSIKAGTRLMIGTNEVPSMIEASDALASRFLILKLNYSFYGNENLNLRRELVAEIPAIVAWALEGLRDLHEVGRFTETDAGLELQREMTEISNPIRTWVEEECEFDAAAFTLTDDLHAEFAVWASQKGYYVPNPAIFARDLMAAFDGVCFAADNPKQIARGQGGPASASASGGVPILRRQQKRIGRKMRRGFRGIKMGNA